MIVCHWALAARRAPRETLAPHELELEHGLAHDHEDATRRIQESRGGASLPWSKFPPLKMRVRQHVNPLKSDFFTIAPQRVGVPAGAALEVELGSGEAWFLKDRAREDPAGFYVGVEIRRDLADKANKECAAEGIDRVQSVFANMSVDLPRLFAERSVRRFFLNFPDPYFKRQQHKRRVLGPTLVDDLARLLAAGGEIHVNTDIFEHGLDAMFLLESDPGQRFENLREPWSFLEGSRFAARSRRDHQCAREGTRVWRLAYRLAGPG